MFIHLPWQLCDAIKWLNKRPLSALIYSLRTAHRDPLSVIRNNWWCPGLSSDCWRDHRPGLRDVPPPAQASVPRVLQGLQNNERAWRRVCGRAGRGSASAVHNTFFLPISLIFLSWSWGFFELHVRSALRYLLDPIRHILIDPGSKPREINAYSSSAHTHTHTLLIWGTGTTMIWRGYLENKPFFSGPDQVWISLKLNHQSNLSAGGAC